MTSQKICLRSDILGTQVITRDTGKRLGVVSQIWVDVDRREVVALSLRENLLAGLISDIPRYMMLSSIRQIGDVILVEDESAVSSNIEVNTYNSLIRNEVITETGELLGKVHSYMFDIDDGRVSSLIISSLGIPQIPDKLISTYELPIEEIVSSGPDRLIVFEGSEERLNQLTVGVLESLGIGKPPWESDEEDDYRPTVIRTENQLGTGVPVRSTASQSLRAAPPVQETWDEDDWEQERRAELKPVRLQQRAESVRYEEDNWSSSAEQDDYEYAEEYEEEAYAEPEPRSKQAYMEYEEEDVWADEEPPYQPKKLNIPEKTRIPEYEEEEG
jgi:sporulation protein YlmC with PRC-barrel domain